MQEKVAAIFNHDTSICTTCVHELKCVIKKNSIHPIWDCSEFSNDYAYSSHSSLMTPLLMNSNVNKTGVGGKGLCQDCELISTCSWFREDAVIFHCEHYQ